MTLDRTYRSAGPMKNRPDASNAITMTATSSARIGWSYGTGTGMASVATSAGCMTVAPNYPIKEKSMVSVGTEEQIGGHPLSGTIVNGECLPPQARSKLLGKP